MKNRKGIVACIGFAFVPMALYSQQPNAEQQADATWNGTGQSMKVLDLSPNDYWNNPQSKLSDYTWELLLSGLETIVMGCPDSIVLDEKSSIPAVVIGCRRKETKYKDRFEGKVLGIAINLQTGDFFTESVLPTPDVVFNGIPPSPGLIVEDFEIDLSKTLGLPLKPATYKAWVAYFDQISDGVIFQIVSTREKLGAKEETAEAAKRATKRSITANLTVDTNDNAFAQGMQIIVPEKGQEGLPSTIHIQGALPVIEGWKVTSEDRNPDLRGISAIIPIDILLIESDFSWSKLSLGVPYSGAFLRKDGKDWASMAISVPTDELLQAERRQNGKAWLYAFSSEICTGPVEMY